MKELFLKIEYSDFVSFEKVISLLRDENFDFVKIEINTTKKISNFELEKIVNAESTFSATVFQNIIALPFHIFINRSFLKNLKKHRFKLLFELDTSKKFNTIVVKNKLNVLKKKKIESAVRVKQTLHGIKDTIDCLNFGNIKYVFENFAYSKKCTEYFNEWIYDKKAPYINVFDDVINNVLLNTNFRDCRHSSCLGKRLYINKNKDFSFCTVQPEKTVLANLADINNFNDIFEQANILNTISYSINKRNTCLNGCEYYDVCKSGCPLLASEKCEENGFIAFYYEVSKTIHTIIKSNNLDKYNEHIKNAVLRYIVFSNTNI